jgi:hypothetical protein
VKRKAGPEEEQEQPKLIWFCSTLSEMLRRLKKIDDGQDAMLDELSEIQQKHPPGQPINGSS